MKRVLLSGLVAGFVFFVWLSIIHLATPLGQLGVRAVPDEQAITTAIKGNVTQPGFYMFPGAVAAPKATKAEKRAAMAAAMEKMKTSPTGIMVVFPDGKAPLAPEQLATELASDIVQGILLAWLLSYSTMTTVNGKIKFAFVVGLAAAFVTNVSYWNWYGFPTNYTLAYMFGTVSGYVAMGMSIAVMTSQPRVVPIAA